MAFRGAIHPNAPTRWQFLLGWCLRRLIDFVGYLVFVFTTASKFPLLLYAGYPGIWLIATAYMMAKTFDLFFEMPWWFEIVDIATTIITLPSSILEVSGIVPPEPRSI